MMNPTKHSLSGAHHRIFVVLAALLLLSVAACDGGCGSGTSSKTVPKTATARITNMSGHLPPSTQVSIVVGDLEQMRTSLKATRDSLGSAVPMTGLIEQQAKSELGIDIFDAKSWEQSGIAANGGVTFAVVGTRPVLVTYVEDPQKFEKAFTDQLKKSMAIEGMPKSETLRETQVKVLGDGDDSVAWAYNGKLIAIAFPESEEIKDYASAEKIESAADLAALIATQDPKSSLGADAGFKSFQKALASEQAVAVYLNPKTLLSDANIGTIRADADPSSKAVVEWARKNISAFGLGLNAKDNSIALRLWAGLPEGDLAKAKAIMTAPAKFPMQNFATAHALVALRQSADMQKLWEFYTQDVLSAEQRAELDEKSSKMGPNGNFNLQTDLIANLTGNYALILYGVDPNAVQAAGGDIVGAVMSAPLQSLAILVPIQFKDKAGLDKLVDFLMKEAGEFATRAAVSEGSDIEVLTVQGVGASAGRIFLKDNLLVYATSPLTNDAVVEYINGERDEKTLGEGTSLNLGNALATQDDYNGLYLNFRRAQDHLLEQMGPARMMVEPFLIKLEEAALTSELGDQGAYLQLSIDLNPDAPKADTADAPTE